MRVYNKSKEIIEKAKKTTCPRCKGYGGLSEDHGDNCYLCNGMGLLYLSESGWTRAFYKRLSDSKLY